MLVYKLSFWYIFTQNIVLCFLHKWICTVSGGNAKLLAHLDGVSQLSALKSHRDSPRKHVLIEIDQNINSYSLISGKWKIIKCMQNYCIFYSSNICIQAMLSYLSIIELWTRKMWSYVQTHHWFSDIRVQFGFVHL